MKKNNKQKKQLHPNVRQYQIIASLSLAIVFIAVGIWQLIPFSVTQEQTVCELENQLEAEYRVVYKENEYLRNGKTDAKGIVADWVDDFKLNLQYRFTARTDAQVSVKCTVTGDLLVQQTSTNGEEPEIIWSQSDELYETQADLPPGETLSIPVQVDFSKQKDTVNRFHEKIQVTTQDVYAVQLRIEKSVTVQEKTEVFVYEPVIRFSMNDPVMRVSEDFEAEPEVMKAQVTGAENQRNALIIVAAFSVAIIALIWFLRTCIFTQPKKINPEQELVTQKLKRLSDFLVQTKPLPAEKMETAIRLTDFEGLQKAAEFADSPIYCFEDAERTTFYILGKESVFTYQIENFSKQPG